MGDFLHRTTKQHLRSIPPDELPEPRANYIENPNLSAVSGQPLKYWTIIGDAIILKDAIARASVDAAILEAQRDTVTAQLDQTEDVLRAFMLVVLDQFNTLRALHGLPNATPAQLRNAVRGKLGS